MTKAYRSSKKKDHILSRIGTYLLLSLVALLCAGPFIWLVLSSLRTGANIYDLHFQLKHFTLSNYFGVIEYMNLGKYVGNTVIITFAGIFLDVLFSAMCAYPLATMDFKGKNVVFGLLVATLIIPAAAGMIINYLTISKLQLLNTYAGVILPTSVKAFSIILLRQAYLGIPKELIEAARIDGAGKLQQILYITIPSILPTIMVMLILEIGRLLTLGFEKILLMYTPNNADVSDIIATLVYRTGLANQNYSYATAIGLFTGVIGIILVASANAASKRLTDESIY